MTTRIVNKLYNCFGTLLATKTSLYNEGVYTPVNVESDLVHVEPQPKRPTKNLESLIKAANEHGYTVSVSQGYNRESKTFCWYAFVHGPDYGTSVAGHTVYSCKTPYQALKTALESINRRWDE